ncbi:conserved hypothetical protein [Streptomyces himastatinicus ATCC 53653]|uniref:Phosphodiester glycosidase domain-containing protein n=1 Tax=Streptomyces himastatinicus ATCC 53653 TaxID=457427 RepID=D9WFI8_9ACTN|nr:phosphodiester glycosidase family protein [Streptomyces himastatinicus]EFL28946.1 conserved hypothetical protein [Streptomyces himastatinicus ATCC 53653]
MTGRGHGTRVRVAAVVLAWAALVGTDAAGAAPAHADARAPRFNSSAVIAPGVEYRTFTVAASHGTVYGHLLSVDLREPGISLDLLTAGAVAARKPVSAMADERGAVAAVNGDFFNISETQHPGVPATGAPVGPAVAGGAVLKSAVPDGQRFGPVLPPGTTTEDVVGLGADQVARLGRLTLQGTVEAPPGTLPLRGVNQYALAEGGVGAYTSGWGTAARTRAVCGTDTDRAAPCGQDTYEVTVRRDVVTQVAAAPGEGAIAPDTVVLVGREAGARDLRVLRVGDPVRVGYRLEGAERAPFTFAVGGFPIVRDDRPLAGLDTVDAAVRTSAGIADGGHRLYLLALDGGPAYRKGLTIGELADLMLDTGAEDAVDLDGGGSSTLVAREPDGARTTVRNHPSGGAERPVPNGIGVFTRH